MTIELSENVIEAIADAVVKKMQEPCEDCVKREDVKSGMIKYGFLAPDMTVTEFVEDLPSVTPKPKTGHWIEVDIRNCHATLKCSVCDRVIKPTFTYGEYSYEDIKEWYPFCHCGADMRGDADETDN